MTGDGFISGVRCGVILGAAAMLLVVSLTPGVLQKLHARRMRKIRESGL